MMRPVLRVQLSNVQEERKASIKSHKLNSLIPKFKGKKIKTLVSASGCDGCVWLKLVPQYYNSQGLI